ncbi:MAG: transglutaminase domain-containing protein [Verrucomicrobiota bacterium JB023]|nr:transglutaminase domain-containing protein [Verrucomicrobiota bacterium JB023]
MKSILAFFCCLPFLATAAIDTEGVTAEAEQRWGETGRKAAQFLIEHMPEKDRATLDNEFLLTNLELAFQAREEFPWAKEVPEEIFFNDVVPYASLDETREDWRTGFLALARTLVEGAESTGEAAQLLNRDLFDVINVHYNRGRKRPNQSPFESRQQGKATCTGLSIILVDACRAVGVPARIVGTALWADKSGNHTWVEVWHENKWNYLGADEYDPKGLNNGWFGGRASKAIPGDPVHAIWATSWKQTKDAFPMVWNFRDRSVPAVDVTGHYSKNKKAAGVGIRVFTERGGKRVPAKIELLDESQKVLQSTTAKAGRADFNDVARLKFLGKGPWTLRLSHEGQSREMTIKSKPKGTLDTFLAEPDMVTQAIEAWEQEGRAEREKELEEKVVRAADTEMKYLEKVFGEEPAGGHSLWISMHGGGGAPPALNDRQWRNQINLYQPAEGFYVAPRAPTDTWNLWHRGHIDPLFDRLIANYVICRNVNPDRIYLMGYSAGGDGVYQLAPRMADRFAAAAMMAGHPNESKPDGLRNLPFYLFMGGEDSAYKRNKIAADWKVKLAALRKEDPEGYPHKVTIYEGLGHWMERKDAEVLPIMAEKTRRTWPKKVVWLQDDTTHERFYWMGVSPEGAVKRRRLEGSIEGQTIAVTGEDTSGLKFWLSDELLDLDQEIIVTLNGEEAFRGKVERSEKVVKQSLAARCGMVATALLDLSQP